MFRKIVLGIVLIIVADACSRMTSVPSPEQSQLLPSPSATVKPSETQEVVSMADKTPPAGAVSEFNTDFTRHAVPYSEILSAGQPRDGIPAINTPAYVSVEEADTWLEDKEPVFLLQIGDKARAYPLQILIWHEIVNDTLNEVPVLVSFCPLCNTAIAFERRIDNKILDFGTTGRLRYSNLIMYDHQTETWWQQATGKGIVGELTGEQLTFVPANIVAWSDFRENYAESDVLSRNTGYTRDYGKNPYPGYDNVDNSPFLYDGPETPRTLPAMARILTLDLNGDAVAYPYDTLSQVRVVEDIVGGVPLVIFWQPGTSSALDQSDIAAGDDVGSIAAFKRMVNGQFLDFDVEEENIIDIQTGSTWDVLGRAVAGPLQGEQLDAVVGVNHFWFSWAAFTPETRVYELDKTGGGVSLDENPPENEGEKVEEELPSVSLLPMDFEIILYQGQEILGEEQVNFSNLLAQNKPVVLVFWAGLCPFCRQEMPDVQAAYLEYGDSVNFIGMDVGLYTNLGSRADAEALTKELGVEFPTGATMDFQILPTYEITSIPTTLFLKPNGQVLYRLNSGAGRDTLFERIEALIAASQS
jgi:thiol-disulfide isomerase/thioredoxin